MAGLLETVTLQRVLSVIDAFAAFLESVVQAEPLRSKVGVLCLGFSSLSVTSGC